MRSLDLGHPPKQEPKHQEDHHTDHDHSGFRRRKRSSLEHRERHGGNGTWNQFCASAEELVLIYGLADNGSASSGGLSRTDLARLSPALLQQILSGACEDVTEPPSPDGLTTTESKGARSERTPPEYVYATIANMVITLTSMFGIVLLLCTSFTSVFQFCIQFCISLAVGSLTGDALLHLTPMEESEPHHCDHGQVLEMYEQERKQKDKSHSASRADLVGNEDNEKSLSEPKERTRGKSSYLQYNEQASSEL
ncbi:Zinc transporter ZIP4 [Liparis tanakae]|uniref:Zinc transporter ZIP4 n=1 Tax=Liparis tanakae TaxID=230148 RepID=A0A4Z2G3J6_9TELE|nr:Zinc transporter ZIP4 [Liparis tanakae]